MILTYDDDFVLEMVESDRHAVRYVGEATMSAIHVADIVHAVPSLDPQSEQAGLEYVMDPWLGR